MELNEYQRRALSTCTPSCKNFAYNALNLVGEVGELFSKVAKMIRKYDADIIANQLQMYEKADEVKPELMKEAGDILWQLSTLCFVMGWPLEDVAQQNLDKLADRAKRGVIVGEGDNR